jgi:hypothetical protein
MNPLEHSGKQNGPIALPLIFQNWIFPQTVFMGVVLLLGKTRIIFILQVLNDLCNGSALLV